MTKEPIMTTCPHCGKETPSGDTCRYCGKEIEFAPGMEVHYKDFKGTEMLDIKMTSHAGQKDARAEKGTESTDDQLLAENKHTNRKVVFFFLAAGVIILSALAWYYLLKFLSIF
ncbi:MAG: hypothetical protein HZB62_00915 [Nitrospirae bacterium]|nr:hypothetical protein [Nitrospirota bacterium]